jgi:FkbM family methyltransferase
MPSFDKLAGYLRELKYCYHSTADASSFWKLLTNTVRFHSMNAIAHDRKGNAVFSIRMKTGNGYNPIVNLRTFGGDIFVLYEVFADQCYYISDTVLDSKKVSVIVDCGANVGLTSIYFAGRYPNATIISVEPHPDNFQLLQRNTKSESRIVPVNAAVVGRARETVRFSNDRPSWGNKISENAGVEIRAITLAELVREYALPSIDLLKVDVEGAEEEIFAQGEFLPSVNCGIIELHDNYSAESFITDLSKWGYVAVWPPTFEGVKMTLFRKA